MTHPINIAIFGAGRWGVHLIRNFHQHPDSQIVAIVDSNPDRLQAVREQFQLPGNIRLVTDGSTIWNLPNLDAVVIATPAVTHFPLISAALENGCHVFTEKPLTLSVSDSLQLCELAQQKQKQLFVDHTYLFHPAVEEGQRVIQSGKLGELRYGYATRTHLEPVRQDVDALWDLAIHDIGIFNHWLGEKPIKVKATGTVWLQPESGLSDLVTATLTYPNGFQAFLHLCWLNPDKQRRLAAVGTQGTLIFDELQSEAPLTLQHGYFNRIDKTWKAAGLNREIIPIQHREPLAQVCDRFLDSIQNHQPSPISSGWVGAELVNILGGLSESLKADGQPILLE
ncbi:Gfo/Idh/MocA family protein [Planktothrix mougeotii]|uniref:Gfo/Idh/MocA family oxidoreductase n=1 Tax=Planktothrix mougeotii LEGE 06226 TaxID=1828728 RepID=A0ABR9UHY4_9CYAN|nr:Gfo/Idh/MocA family oxidoreductase [Planktothrix mougeotii]MBE9146072.1 Gfo/Idh/MocA family oxidoreductase [Planktothrix mougeotii LEGE 06226]